jgi:hypothetical protein
MLFVVDLKLSDNSHAVINNWRKFNINWTNIFPEESLKRFTIAVT